MSTKNNPNHHLLNRNGTWYIIARQTVNGKTKRISQSTGIGVGDPTPRKALLDARRLRDAMLRAWRQDKVDLLDGIKMRDTSSKLRRTADDYLRIVERHGKPRMSTARRNVMAMASFIRLVADCELEAASVNTLDRKAVITYTDRMLARGGDLESTQITINSTLRQVRSIFKRSLVGEYPAALVPADLPGFLSQFACVDPMRQKVREVRPPTAAEMAPLVEGSLLLRGTNLYSVWLLNYHMGMRVSEIEHCQWCWFDEDEFGRQSISISVRHDPEWRPKGRSRTIPIAADVWAELESCRGSSPFVTPGPTKSPRNVLTHRTYNTWIKTFPWHHTKISHAVRAYRLECWRRAYGDSVLRDWGGHVSLQTSLDHYAGNCHADAPLGLDG